MDGRLICKHPGYVLLKYLANNKRLYLQFKNLQAIYCEWIIEWNFDGQAGMLIKA